MIERIALKTFYNEILNHEVIKKIFLTFTECYHVVVGKEISVEVNNAMVLSNDVILTERKFKLILFSTIITHRFIQRRNRKK